MVGLTVVLEGSSCSSNSSINNKTTIMFGTSSINKSSSPPSPPPSSSAVFFASSSSATTTTTTLFQQAPFFLDQCFLCRKKLLPGKDIYMYKGDRAFCSVDCRGEHILTDEEEGIQKEKCSSSEGRHQRKGK